MHFVVEEEEENFIYIHTNIYWRETQLVYIWQNAFSLQTYDPITTLKTVAACVDKILRKFESNKRKQLDKKVKVVLSTSKINIGYHMFVFRYISKALLVMLTPDKRRVLTNRENKSTVFLYRWKSSCKKQKMKILL
jgi:hypothetical protein